MPKESARRKPDAESNYCSLATFNRSIIWPAQLVLDFERAKSFTVLRRRGRNDFFGYGHFFKYRVGVVEEQQHHEKGPKGSVESK